MPWIKLSKDYDYKTSPQSVTAYKKDGEYLVSEKARDEMKAAGVAGDIDDPTEARKRSKRNKAEK